MSIDNIYFCNVFTEEQDEGDTVQAVATIGPAVKSAATSQMEAAVVALARELSKLRTGRAQSGNSHHNISIISICGFSLG